MQKNWPGVRVKSVSVVEIGGDQGSSGRVFRLTLQTEGGAAADGRPVPKTLMLKLPKDTFSRAFMEVSYVHESELGFYETVQAAKTPFPIPTPISIVKGHTRKGGFWFLIMDDLTERPGCDLAVRPKFSDVENIKLALRGLATFHAELWQSSRLEKGGDFGWLRTNQDKYAALPPLIKATFPKFKKTLASRVPADVVERGLRLLEDFPFILRALSTPPFTLNHADATPINGFFVEDPRDGQKKFGLYDWQVCVRGKAMFDVALMLNHVPQAVIEANEEQLLRYYLDELQQKARAAGVSIAYSYEQAIEDYKLGWALTFLRNMVGFSVVPLDNAAANIYYESMTLAAQAIDRWKIIDDIHNRAQRS